MPHKVLIAIDMLIVLSLGWACFILWLVGSPIARMMATLFLFFFCEMVLATVAVFFIGDPFTFSAIKIPGRIIELAGVMWFIYKLIHIEKSGPCACEKCECLKTVSEEGQICEMCSNGEHRLKPLPPP